MAQRMTYTIEDFSGGITDYPLNAAPNQSADLRNLLVNPNKKVFQRPGSTVFTSDTFQIPTSGTKRVTGMFEYGGQLFATDGNRLFKTNGATWTEILGPTGNVANASWNDQDVLSIATWNDHVYVTSDDLTLGYKVFNDGAGVTQLRTLGLPRFNVGAVTFTPPGPGSNNYLYAFVYRSEYTVNTVLFVDLSNPAQSATITSNNAVSGAHPIALSTIPVLSNTSSTNYDTVNLDIEVYRTQNNGNIFYKVATISNGTTTYSDTTTDVALVNNQVLYTTGGIVGNTQPLPARCMAVVNGKAYYGVVKEGTEVLENVVAESVQDDPDSVPSTFRTQLDDKVIGVSGYNGLPLVFCNNRIYRIEGEYQDDGQGFTQAREISPNAGCVSHNSIVPIRGGVVWAGNDGFYWTDGYRVQKISESINLSYKTFVSDATRRKRIVGAYDRQENRVYWSVYGKADSSDCDTIWVLDLFFGISDNSTFSYMENGTYFAPTYIIFNSTSNLIRGDRRGYIFKHYDNVRTDPRVNALLAPTAWGTKTIIWNYKTTSIDCGAPEIRKWGIQVLARFSNLSNFAAQINSINDDNPVVAQLTPILYRGNIVWGDPYPIWGTDDYRWNWNGLIEQRRRLVAGSIRFSYKTLQVTNAYVPVYNSDIYGTATTNASTKTVTKDPTVPWPTNMLDYKISFAWDNYTLEYDILSTDSASQITVSDPSNTLLTVGSTPWLIKGYPKSEGMEMHSLVLYFVPMSATQPTFYGGTAETGLNSGS